jgi:enterochelin esterase-like enzyme
MALAFVTIAASACTPSAPLPSPTGAPLPSAWAEPSATGLALASTATPVVPCASPGRIELGAYPGVVLDESLSYRIYLPPCYSADSGSYPILYVLHGKPFDDSHWDGLGLDEAAEAEIAGGNLSPFLIVMPNVPEPLFSSTDGGPGSYEQEFIEGLVPTIESTYAADPRPASRALAGISRGGVWALEIGLRHADAFDGLAALSPALAVNRPRPEYDPFEIAATSGPFPGRIFLAAGETDWARAGTERFAGILEQGGVSPQLRIVPGGHEARAWEASIGPMLQALAARWAAPN